MKKRLLYLLLLSSLIGVSQNDIGNVLTDMVFLSKQFVAPAADASVYQSSSSWYSSAKGLEKFQVDVSLHANVLPISNRRKTHKLSNSDFASMHIRGAETATVPTALGGDTNTFFDFTINGDQFELQAFEGVNEDVLAHPYLQASIGLWKETDLTLRYSPKIKVAVSDYQIFGGAIKHNLTQYNRKENSVEVAVLVSYSKFDLDLFFDPFKLESTNAQPGDVPLATIDSVIVDANSWLFQFIGSKEFGNFEVSGSLGFTRNNFDYSLGGDESLLLDLFNASLQVLDETRNGFKGDVGLNYHFKKFYISSMVTIGKFANCNVALHYKI